MQQYPSSSNLTANSPTLRTDNLNTFANITLEQTCRVCGIDMDVLSSGTKIGTIRERCGYVTCFELEDLCGEVVASVREKCLLCETVFEVFDKYNCKIATISKFSRSMCCDSATYYKITDYKNTQIGVISSSRGHITVQKQKGATLQQREISCCKDQWHCTVNNSEFDLRFIIFLPAIRIRLQNSRVIFHFLRVLTQRHR